MFSSILPKKLLFLFAIFGTLAAPSLHAQEEIPQQNNFWNNVRFGGSLGASLSDGYFSAFLAPRAVYDFNRYFSAGTGVSGNFTNASNYSAFTVGGSILGLFRPFNGIQLSTEFEESYVSKNLNLDGADLEETYWYPSLFLGLGYNAGAVTVGVRYDVLYNDNTSIYGSAFMPFVSVYF